MKTFTSNPESLSRPDTACSPQLRLTSLTYIQARDDPSWEFPLHAHAGEWEVSVVLSGHAQIFFEGRRYEVRAGDIVLKRPGSLHAEKSDHSDPIEQVCMAFDHVFPEDEKSSGGDRTLMEQAGPVLRLDDFPLLSMISVRIRDMCAGEGAGSELDALCRAFMEVLTAACRKSHAQRSDGRDNLLVREVRSYIDTHYAEKITLEMLSGLYYVSPFYLERVFRRETGFSLRQYQIDRRIGEAERMLVFGEEDIREIALRCGYDNVQYFYTAFRKHVGCTPKEFKSRYK